MRSARILLVTAAASAALVAPAYAAGDWNHDDSSYSREHEDSSSSTEQEDSSSSKEDDGREHDGKEHDGKEHDGRDHDGKEHDGKEHDGRDHDGKEHDGKEHGKHERPHGGIHTGGGALTLVKADGDTARDTKHEEADKDKEAKDSDHGKDSSWTKDGEDSWKKGDHDKPHGGMHTGGGALAAPTVSAGGLALLALAGTGLYVVRRKKSADGLA